MKLLKTCYATVSQRNFETITVSTWDSDDNQNFFSEGNQGDLNKKGIILNLYNIFSILICNEFYLFA